MPKGSRGTTCGYDEDVLMRLKQKYKAKRNLCKVLRRELETRVQDAKDATTRVAQLAARNKALFNAVTGVRGITGTVEEGLPLYFGCVSDGVASISAEISSADSTGFWCASKQCEHCVIPPLTAAEIEQIRQLYGNLSDGSYRPVKHASTVATNRAGEVNTNVQIAKKCTSESNDSVMERDVVSRIPVVDEYMTLRTALDENPVVARSLPLVLSEQVVGMSSGCFGGQAIVRGGRACNSNVNETTLGSQIITVGDSTDDGDDDCVLVQATTDNSAARQHFVDAGVVTVEQRNGVDTGLASHGITPAGSSTLPAGQDECNRGIMLPVFHDSFQPVSDEGGMFDIYPPPVEPYPRFIVSNVMDKDELPAPGGRVIRLPLLHSVRDDYLKKWALVGRTYDYVHKYEEWKVYLDNLRYYLEFFRK